MHRSCIYTIIYTLAAAHPAFGLGYLFPSILSCVFDIWCGFVKVKTFLHPLIYIGKNLVKMLKLCKINSNLVC